MNSHRAKKFTWQRCCSARGMSDVSLLHLVLPAPRLPRRSRYGRASAMVTVALHVAVAVVLAVLTFEPAPFDARRETAHASPEPVQVPRMVFLAVPGPRGGGGGGGNRQPTPPSRAQVIGRDRITMPVARPARAERTPAEPEAPQLVVLNATPLAAGIAYRLGMPEAPPSLAFPHGPGVGGGSGEGTGTGLGSGMGPGFGPGSGGGFGGGTYRPGNGVTAPTLLTQVRPNYTAEAMQRKIQGTVVLEMIVGLDGTPRDVRVVRSLDAYGLDAEAMRAARQWRFNPGRLGETPVDVLVILMIDFYIR
jgi:protein TonB